MPKEDGDVGGGGLNNGQQYNTECFLMLVHVCTILKSAHTQP